MRFPGVLLLCICAGCGAGSAALLSATDIVVYKPLPGTSMSAGYLTLANESSNPVLVTSVTSPQFGRVEMHESITLDDVSRMQRINELKIDPGERVRFEPGGKHLMLMQAREPLQSVTLNFYSADSLLLSVNTRLSDH